MKNNAFNPFRKYLLNSKSKEELTVRTDKLYNFTSFFFWKFGPRASKRLGVNERLDFFLNQIKPGQKIVDVGCFDGFFTESLAKRGYDVTGVDRSSPILNQTQKLDSNGKYFKGIAEEMPFNDSSFDVGIYSHVLHHTYNPDKAIKEAKRILKPRGKIIAVVPYELGSTHLRVFSPHDLISLISTHFKKIETHPEIGISHACIGYKE